MAPGPVCQRLYHLRLRRIAGNSPAGNFNLVGRLFYSASTMVCFADIHRAAAGPFNMVVEAA